VPVQTSYPGDALLQEGKPLRLSTKSRYGTRAVLDIATHSHQGPVTLNDISARQEISKKYLEQIVHRLLKVGLLVSVRGPQGGYLLAKTPARIRLGEIIRALDGPVAPVRCVDEPRICDRARHCVTRHVWSEIKQSVEAVIDRITIADLTSRQSGVDGLLSPTRKTKRGPARPTKSR